MTSSPSGYFPARGAYGGVGYQELELPSPNRFPELSLTGLLRLVRYLDVLIAQQSLRKAELPIETTRRFYLISVVQP